jgi:hypothetical protein
VERRPKTPQKNCEEKIDQAAIACNLDEDTVTIVPADNDQLNYVTTSNILKTKTLFLYKLNKRTWQK